MALFILLCCSCNNNTRAKGRVAVEHLRALDSTEANAYRNALTRFFDSLLLRGNFSGGILVAKNGQVLYENYKGFADGEKNQPITPDTRFHVASTSKTFTSTAVLQLVNQGKIHLDDSIQVYFPLFPYQGITVRNLLNHSSGLPNYANLFPLYKWDEKHIANNFDVLYLFYANRPALEFTPGSRFRYSNTNFALLALMVEKVTGRSFPDYVHDSIFVRSGMNNSLVLSTRNPEKYMPSWDPSGRIYDYNFLDGIYGDKNIYTTCRDLMKYDSAIRNNLLLPQALYDSAWTPNFQDKHYNDSREYYGLGWRLKIFSDSLKIVYHNGWWHGNNAVFQRLIADTAVIIITGNRFSRNIYSSVKAVDVFRKYYGIFVEEEETDQGQSSRMITPSKKKYGVPSRRHKTNHR